MKLSKTILFNIPSVLLLSGFAYIHRFEIGIGNPKYKVGQCVEQVVQLNEFQTTVFKNKIAQIGKVDYKLEYLFSNSNPPRFTAGSINWIDMNYKEIPCPKTVSSNK